MQMYLVFNVETLKLYELLMILVHVQSPFGDDFAFEYLNEIQEYVILDKKVKSSLRGYMYFLHVGLKVMHPSKERWLETERVRELYPHLFSK